MVYALFWCYTWDLETTHYGLGLGDYPLTSIAAVPTYFFVFAPDVGAIAWNISNIVDKKTRSLRGNAQQKPTQGQKSGSYVVNPPTGVNPSNPVARFFR